MGNWDASLRLYLQAAKAAVTNATDLAASAKSLRDQGRAGTAASLSTIGREEVGKAFMFWLVGFGIVPESKVADVLRMIKTEHRTKQSTSLVSQIMANLGLNMTQEVERLWGDQPDTEATLSRVAEPMVSRIVALVDEAFRADPQIEKRAEEIQNGRVLEVLKHRGLYVDVVEGRINTPASVTKEEADRAIAELDAALQGIAILVPLFDAPTEGITIARDLLNQHLSHIAPSQASQDG